MNESNSINKNISGKNLFEGLAKIKMIDAPEDFSTNFGAYGIDGLSENEIMLLLAYRQLSKEEQQQVLELIASFGQENLK